MTFNARLIADEARARGEDPVRSILGQLAGYASVCWEDMSGTGTFQSNDAGAAVDSAYAVITSLPEHRTVAVPRLDAGDRLLIAFADNLDREAVDGVRTQVRAWLAGPNDPDDGTNVGVISGGQLLVVSPDFAPHQEDPMPTDQPVHAGHGHGHLPDPTAPAPAAPERKADEVPDRKQAADPDGPLEHKDA